MFTPIILEKADAEVRNNLLQLDSHDVMLEGEWTERDGSPAFILDRITKAGSENFRNYVDSFRGRWIGQHGTYEMLYDENALQIFQIYGNGRRSKKPVSSFGLKGLYEIKGRTFFGSGNVDYAQATNQFRLLRSVLDLGVDDILGSYTEVEGTAIFSDQPSEDTHSDDLNINLVETIQLRIYDSAPYRIHVISKSDYHRKAWDKIRELDIYQDPPNVLHIPKEDRYHLQDERVWMLDFNHYCKNMFPKFPTQP